MSKKILIIRLGAIGDVVHSTVISQAIKAKHPDSVIHFLTSDSIAPLLKNDINLDKVIEFTPKKHNNFLFLLALGIQLRKEKYDTIISLSNSIRNFILLFLAAPKNIVKRSRTKVHAIDAFFNSAKEVYSDIEYPKKLSLAVGDEVKTRLAEKIKDYPRPYVVFSPGGEHNEARQGRIWPAENWIELGNQISQKYGGTTFIVGSPAEKNSHKDLLKIENSKLFSGELSLEESSALFSHSDLFVSGDSGPLHMASALNVAAIGIMGSTPAIACGPYGEGCYSISPAIECSGCGEKLCAKLPDGEIYTPCIKSISPEMVLDLIEENKLL